MNPTRLVTACCLAALIVGCAAQTELGKNGPSGPGQEEQNVADASGSTQSNEPRPLPPPPPPPPTPSTEAMALARKHSAPVAAG
jgi:hypothetical protein